jgi:hypothetical protein
MSFRITGLDGTQFEHLFGMSDGELARHRAERYVADEKPGFPCRVSLEDAEPGESLLLVPYRHHDVATAYAGEGPIFVRERRLARAELIDEIPGQLTARLISLRAYDRRGMMIDADAVDGATLRPLIERFLADDRASYLHAHFARRGCYAAQIERA